MKYASVLSKDSVRSNFFVVVLNDLDILYGDIHTAYQNADTKEKKYYMPGMNENLIKGK